MEEEYKKPSTMIIKDQDMVFTCNVKAMNSLLADLPKSKLVKVMYRAIAKSIWDKKSNYYECDNKVK